MSEAKPKNCYGHYEDDACSWHCKGCMFVEGCKEYQLKIQEIYEEVEKVMEGEDEQTE